VAPGIAADAVSSARSASRASTASPNGHGPRVRRRLLSRPLGPITHAVRYHSVGVWKTPGCAVGIVWGLDMGTPGAACVHKGVEGPDAEKPGTVVAAAAVGHELPPAHPRPDGRGLSGPKVHGSLGSSQVSIERRLPRQQPRRVRGAGWARGGCGSEPSRRWKGGVRALIGSGRSANGRGPRGGMGGARRSWSQSANPRQSDVAGIGLAARARPWQRRPTWRKPPGKIRRGRVADRAEDRWAAVRPGGAGGGALSRPRAAVGGAARGRAPGGVGAVVRACGGLGRR
jgi:hypothetical protein